MVNQSTSTDSNTADFGSSAAAGVETTVFFFLSSKVDGPPKSGRGASCVVEACY